MTQQPRTMASTGGDNPSMFAAVNSNFEFKSKRCREAYAKNAKPENWFVIQKRIDVSDNLLKSLWTEMECGLEDAVAAGVQVDPEPIYEATRALDDMKACVIRAKQFVDDAKQVFKVAEHRSKDRSDPSIAIEMLHLKTMAGGVVSISKEYEDDVYFRKRTKPWL